MIEKMDLDIGSLIYILMAVVAVIAGVAGKKKKKLAPGTADEAPESKSQKGGFFGKLEQQLENFATEAQQSINKEQPPPLPQEEEVVIERDYFENLTDEYENKQQDDFRNNVAAYEGIYSPDDIENDPLMEAEGIPVTDALELIHLDEDHTRSFDNHQIVEDFDLRTAVIYSTIINRIEI